MKKRKNLTILIVFLFLFIFSVSTTWAASRLVWDASSETVNGYIVYWGKTSDSGYPNSHQVEGLTCPLDDLHLIPGESYKFVVTAWNSRGESGYSNEVTWNVPIFTPPPDNIPPTIINIPGPVTIIVNTD